MILKVELFKKLITGYSSCIYFLFLLYKVLVEENANRLIDKNSNDISVLIYIYIYQNIS